MSKVPSSNTTPEKLVRKWLHGEGFRFRINVENLPGKPDIVLKKYNTIIFVHGCFWHRHKNCKRASMPATNSKYWEDKFQKNIERDKRNKKELKKLGWNVLIIWECEINENKLKKLKKMVLDNIFDQ